MNRPISGIVDVLALQDPPIHSRQRRIAMKSLSPKFFRSLEDEVRVLSRCLFEKIFKSESNLLVVQLGLVYMIQKVKDITTIINEQV